MKKAIILLSGGLDSTTVLALAKSQGYELYALSFDYGQKHNTELQRAKSIAKAFNVSEHQVITLAFSKLARSALTQSQIEVENYQGSDNIPTTYVPARNTVFLSIALGWAESLDCFDIFIGSSAIDYSGYPDCRPDYFKAFQAMADLATKSGVEGNPIKIHTPLIHLSKAETIQLGHSLGVNYQETVSCYRLDAEGKACGQCDSCVLRKRGFVEAGLEDPTYYTRDPW